jgi:Flp pilus assembly protein TadG
MIFSSVSGQKSVRGGSAAVEFAIVAPLLFTLVVGIMQFGRILMVQQILVTAAEAGARTAIMTGKTDANVSTAISNFMSAANITGYSSSDSPLLSTSPASGTAIAVTVSVPYTSIGWTGSVPIDFSKTTLSASVTMIKD